MDVMARVNELTSGRVAVGPGTLYNLLEHSMLFHGTTQSDSRSIANVTFRTDDAELDAAFVAGAAEHQIQNVKGHRLVGGMRASIYNAMPIEGVEKLVAFMREFEKKHTN